MVKNSFFDKWKNTGVHSVKLSNYFDVYQNILSPFIGKKITLVEIGVLHGGPLHFWRKIFGTDIKIIGIEINEGAKKWESEGFEIYIGDQGNKFFWKSFF